jgi:hypothetical protein
MSSVCAEVTQGHAVFPVARDGTYLDGLACDHERPAAGVPHSMLACSLGDLSIT